MAKTLKGRDLLAELEGGGLADPGLDYDEVMAALARGLPPVSVLRPSLRGRGFFTNILSAEERRLWDLMDKLVAIARAPYLLPEAPDPPAVEWNRLADDLERTTGHRLDITFTWEQWSEDDYWMVGYLTDGSQRGAFMARWKALDGEHMLAELADRLCESHLHEEIWSGWPMCPNHPTRPMWATVNEDGQAVWQCEADPSDDVSLGHLAR